MVILLLLQPLMTSCICSDFLNRMMLIMIHSGLKSKLSKQNSVLLDLLLARLKWILCLVLLKPFLRSWKKHGSPKTALL